MKNDALEFKKELVEKNANGRTLEEEKAVNQIGNNARKVLDIIKRKKQEKEESEER